MEPDKIEVEHNADESRFEVALDGKLALLNYRLMGASIAFIHTEVPADFEGRGIGGKLALAGLEYARTSGLTVVPRCPFIAGYIARHPEYADIVALHH
jgi:predicted GNAT family acetyltransferase